MYARLERAEALENVTRYTIHGLVLENPGIQFSALAREMDLCNGEAEYHLTVLEREGFLRVVRDGNLKRYYPVNVNVPDELRLTADEMRDRIVELVRRTPGVSQKQLVDELCAGRSLVGYHISCLLREGLLKQGHRGRFRIYTAARSGRGSGW